MTAALTILFGLLVGLALGLTGGGGSVFAIPLLVFGLGLDAHQAVTLSLAAVAAMALIGALNAARLNLVEYRAGLIFAIAGAVAAPLGVGLANGWNERGLLVGFSVLVMVVAARMWLKAERHGEESRAMAEMLKPEADSAGPVCKFIPGNTTLRLTAPCSLALALTGAVTGILSGLFGVGGGFVIVPALTFVTRLSIHRAVATSLFVIALVGGSGVVSGLAAGRVIPWSTGAIFVAGGVAGLLMGQQVARRLAGPLLQKGFAAAMILLGVVTFAAKL